MKDHGEHRVHPRFLYHNFHDQKHENDRRQRPQTVDRKELVKDQKQNKIKNKVDELLKQL